MTLSTWGKPSSTGATQSSNKMSTAACGRNLFSANSAGVDNTVSPIERSRTTSTRSTVCQSQRAGASGCGDSSRFTLCLRRSRNCGDDSTISRKLFKGRLLNGNVSSLFCSPILRAALRVVLYRRFVNQHHRNVVADGINAAALDAFQSAAIGLQLDLRLADGASEYFQQILTDWHRVTSHCGFQVYKGAPWKEALGMAKLITRE